MPDSAADALRRKNVTSSPLLVPCLLTAVGGLIDCFAWMTFGRVFTNAQSGNIVLCFVYAAEGQWQRAFNHVPPMLAFFPGLFAAHWLRRWSGPDCGLQAAIACLGIEILVLAAVGLLPPGVPDAPIVFLIAFVAAMQNAAFASIDKWSYASVVTTGNLRTLGKALFHGVFPGRNPEAAEQARTFGAVCLCFVLGAAAGAFATARLGRSAIAIPIALLLLALAACLRERNPSRKA